MSILIAYATKYGMTGDYARAMAAIIGRSAALLDLGSSEAGNIDLKPYETIILGASVYAGSPRPVLGKFIANRGNELAGKKLALFLCGLAGLEGGRSVLDAAFPAALRQAATAVAYLPGFVDPTKANAFERFIVRMIEKSEAKKGKKPAAKPDIAAEAAAFIKRGGLCA